MMVVEKKIGNVILSQRTTYSKLQVFNEDGENITNTSTGEMIIDEYEAQTKEPERYFDIDGNVLNAYHEVGNLNYVFVPDHIKKIEISAFSGAEFKFIHMPHSIEYICDGAFESCFDLKEVVLPNALHYIANWNLFRNCKSLEKINIPEHISGIRRFTFDGCDSLENIILPDNLTSIDMHAFSNCKNLKEIHIPDSVMSIENYSFSGCEKLDTINIPSKLNHVGQGVFSDTNIKTIKINSDFPVGQISEYGDFLTNKSIEKIIIDGSVSFIDPLLMTQLYGKVKEIDFLGGADEFRRFSSNNKELMLIFGDFVKVCDNNSIKSSGTLSKMFEDFEEKLMR